MEYNKCLVQLDEVLSYLSTDNLEKIPYEVRHSIKQQKDKEYDWEYDESKTLKEQELDNLKREGFVVVEWGGSELN